MNIRIHRLALGISQSKLARMSGVSRFKICTFELGSGNLSADEQARIQKALQTEADRLRTIPISLDIETAPPAPPPQDHPQIDRPRSVE